MNIKQNGVKQVTNEIFKIDAVRRLDLSDKHVLARVIRLIDGKKFLKVVDRRFTVNDIITEMQFYHIDNVPEAI